jgi:hypothetical protein
VRSESVPPAYRCPAKWAARLPQNALGDSSDRLCGSMASPSDLTDDSRQPFDLANREDVRRGAKPIARQRTPWALWLTECVDAVKSLTARFGLK